MRLFFILILFSSPGIAETGCEFLQKKLGKNNPITKIECQKKTITTTGKHDEAFKKLVEQEMKATTKNKAP